MKKTSRKKPASPGVAAGADGSHPSIDALMAAKLAEFDDVKRHRREIERLQAAHLVEVERLNNAHIEHVSRIEATHAETIAHLKAICDEIKGMRLEAKPPLVWWPTGPNDPGPLMPQPYRDPITCDANTEGSRDGA